MGGAFQMVYATRMCTYEEMLKSPNMTDCGLDNATLRLYVGDSWKVKPGFKVRLQASHITPQSVCITRLHFLIIDLPKRSTYELSCMAVYLSHLECSKMEKKGTSSQLPCLSMP